MTGSSAPAAALDPASDRAAVEAFLIHEADLIDRRDFEAWLALYTDDCRYWVPLEEDQADPQHTVSLIYDDRKLLETRVRRLGHPRIHAQAPPSRTVHIIANVAVAREPEDGLIVVHSNQTVAEYRQNRTRLFAGRCTHRLVPENGGYRIAFKRIDLIDSEGENRGIPIVL
ncbi:MAG: aromatic-ring-hydroxylating dioxygenase subunit beta [Rhodospirillaceae bacterium]|nr:aromatic-ring-hydroxylating dioxygenase subunit beta [Rhodospirillaceae bacterium]MYB15253.1 aromatic-ring-hydroxylating dioxygenase subunit beta [Rhodospirillaceae bacterium]MYI50736.1 aromatic-ring-hydroxylating dioxygenase subunit beta [Rhodospirillaceae bacterium]